ncbi:MAG TPA: methylene-tetrahydromethanopterin dehydrogenase N-terminal domain-containing protein [Baekduia sp.]
MKKILIQLDTDEHPSTFDAIVAHDAGVDALLRYGGIEPGVVRGLVQSAFFTRGTDDLATLAVWVGGSSVGAGEAVLGEVEKAFFGPFRVSAMLDSNGCNTTAATTVARLAREIDLKGRRVVIVGAGAVGLRAAKLLIDEGCEVTVSGIPAARFGDQPYHRARGLTVAQERGMDVVEPADDAELAKVLDGATLVLAAGPAGVELLPEELWRAIDSIEVLADFNAAEPLGIAGTGAQDDLKDYDGKRVLGALAIGGPKMKVHKACVRRLFESNDAVLDVDGVYAIAKELA